MINPTKKRDLNTLFSSFEDQLDLRHPLCLLSEMIDWELFEREFSPLYHPTKGRPCKPIRLMCGLLILKHVRNISDESVVAQWSENSYYQYFCGEKSFVANAPCNPTELVHFRKRIGESGIELVFKESIRVSLKHEEDKKNRDKNNGNKTKKKDDIVIVDTTVQEKNITYPTDSKLHNRIIDKILAIVYKLDLPLRRSYSQRRKQLALAQRYRNHPKNNKIAKKADKEIKTIAKRLLRELERNIPSINIYWQDIALFKAILNQTKNSKNKIYSLHEPDVKCICKGKEHKKYEFGNKVSIAKNMQGIIVSALSFRNEYDGHTIGGVVDQVEKLTGKLPDKIAGDRGYRGKKKVKGVEVIIPSAGKKSDTRYQKEKQRKIFRKRAGIEPTIGHLKSDFRLSRNFYKGVVGDNINVMLAAAAYNFKRMMKILLAHFYRVFIIPFLTKISDNKNFAIG